ncbi:MAG: UbiA family prenyltransferase, partial [Bacteroidales bacterium]|nr:UbiA family prenyltransferase [Bacteroidales bacterium]
GFDIIYSLQDEDFDKNNKLFSLPSKLGTKNALLVSEIMHFGVVVLIVLLGIIFKLKYLYFIGVAIFTAMLIWQHLLVNKKTQKNIGFAFGTTNGIASVLFGLFAIADLIVFSNQYPVF